MPRLVSPKTKLSSIPIPNQTRINSVLCDDHTPHPTPKLTFGITLASGYKYKRSVRT
jgi:hypothetical protein